MLSSYLSSKIRENFDEPGAIGRNSHEFRDESSASAPWPRAFVDFMWKLADHFAPKKLHEQRGVFGLHEANFRRALELSDELEMELDGSALTQSLAAWAQNTRNFAEARRLFEDRARRERERGNPEGEAASYHHLGIIAQEQRDFEQARTWYLRSLEIREKQGDEHGAAQSYHQLGMIAEEQRDFEQARTWYLRSLEISEKLGIEHGAAISYHQLGMIAQEQRDFEQARTWYLRSLEIEEKQGNEHGAAQSYHQLGMIAQEQRDFEQARTWYLRQREAGQRARRGGQLSSTGEDRPIAVGLGGGGGFRDQSHFGVFADEFATRTQHRGARLRGNRGRRPRGPTRAAAGHGRRGGAGRGGIAGSAAKNGEFRMIFAEFRCARGSFRTKWPS
ncbi:MAG: tetratricopeptide (TPR) repeat protein [Verrucomicrobiales bacterium]